MKKFTILFFALLMPLLTMAQTAQDCYRKGLDYYYGWNGVVKDYNEAIKWVRKAAEQGYGEAQENLGYMYLKGLGTTKDEKEALKWYRKAAEQGRCYAQEKLGYMYLKGLGTTKDGKEAVKWYQKAAEQGLYSSLNALGIMYKNGDGVDRDYNEAVKWYRKAAEKGWASSQYNLGIMYINGYGVEKDYIEAVKWYRKAAEQGNAAAQTNLGYMYSKGYGVEKDYIEAVKWYRKAAEQGDDTGQNNLGYMYYNGYGVEKDFKEAYRWYMKAISQKNAYAMEGMGELYEYGGHGVTQNYQVAKEWYQKALNMEPEMSDAKDGLARIEKILSEQSNEIDPVDSNIPMLGRVNKSTFAIIIANEDYQGETKVDYARNDGEVFKSYCHKTLGLPEKNVHFVANATRNNIIGELFWLEQVCKAFNGEASAIFYYAGHGLPDENSGTAYLLPVDGNSQILPTCYSIKELYETLGKLPAKKVTVLMDACFSGAKRNGGMLASARGVAIKAKMGAPKGSMIVLSAAKGDETAYKHEDAKHGLFTYFLLKKLKDSKGNVTLGELSHYIQDQVGRYSIVENGKSQTPTIQTSEALRNSWQGTTLY